MRKHGAPLLYTRGPTQHARMHTDTRDRKEGGAGEPAGGKWPGGARTTRTGRARQAPAREALTNARGEQAHARRRTEQEKEACKWSDGGTEAVRHDGEGQKAPGEQEQAKPDYAPRAARTNSALAL